jgi:5-formyltetrahydrofolate cyclo-ligase
VVSKADVRTAALARRASVSEQDRHAFAERLAAIGPRIVHDFAPPGERLAVSLFSAIGSEPDLSLLAAALHAAGVVTALPVTVGRTAPLDFRRWSPGDPLRLGPLRVPQPMLEAPPVVPDVLFVPLAAFDRRGHRIGYGGGHYDRTLQELRVKKPVRAIGVAYAVQEELFIPSEEHDEPLDLVLTDRETLLCGE